MNCFDFSLADFPRKASDEGDSERIERALECAAHGILYIPAGVYEITKTVAVKNLSSLLLHKSAILRAVREMDFILVYNAELQHNKELRTPDMPEDYNLFIRGGQFDGNGLASCVSLANYHHFTFADSTFLNGKLYGLRVDDFGHGYELIANNLYFKTVMRGLAGNIAVSTCGGDSHYTDCVAVDYTIGFELLPGAGANRLTRCHVWGGPVPTVAEGRPPEMLENSINFKICDGGSILRDCYADSGQTGFYIDTCDVRLCGCSYFNNPRFGLDDITIIRHIRGRLSVTDCRFAKTVPHVTVYSGATDGVLWRDNTYFGFTSDDKIYS